MTRPSAFGSLAPIENRRRLAAERQKRRTAEIVDAVDFLFTPRGPDGEDVHAPSCLFAQEGGTACSRDYALAETEPLINEQDYVGTGIGLLYGLGGEAHAWQLAGWNVKAAS